MNLHGGAPSPRLSRAPRAGLQRFLSRPLVETTLPFNISNEPIPGVRQAADLARIAFGLDKIDLRSFDYRTNLKKKDITDNQQTLDNEFALLMRLARTALASVERAPGGPADRTRQDRSGALGRTLANQPTAP